MLILAGSIRLAQGKREATLEQIRHMVEATRAEPGCLSYAFALDVMDDHLIRIFEVFTDEAALAAHRASPHMATWRAASQHLGISDRDLSQYDISAARKI